MSKKITRREMLQIMGLATGTLLSCSHLPLPTVAEPEVTRASNTTLSEKGYMPYVSRPFSSSWTGTNFISIMCDTLRYDHVGFHGNSTIQTPHLDAFAAQSQVFDHAYSGGFPTLLNRAEIFTGRYAFTYMGWEDMPDDEVVLAKVLDDAGYITGLVFDTLHLKSHPFSFDRGFASWRWIRGQENDRYHPTPLDPALPADPSKFRHGSEVITQYLRNVSQREDESNYFVAETVQTAIEWLRDHAKDKFFLHVDAFDPHEPWDPPSSYVDLYDPGYEGEEVIYPAYAPADYLTAEELAHVRALYNAEVTMVDHWLGELFAEIDRLGLQDNTIVILSSDHGILLGEHDVIGKSWDHQGHYECYPLYQELIHIPLMIRVPWMPPRRISSLVQPADLMPTILEWAEAEDPGTMHGRSLVPVIEEGGASTVSAAREYIVSGRSLGIAQSAAPCITVHNGEWTLIHGGTRSPSELYNVLSDPLQSDNRIADRCEVAQNLHGKLVEFLEGVGTAEDYINPWRTSPC